MSRSYPRTRIVIVSTTREGVADQEMHLDMGLQVLRRTEGQERPWTVTAATNARLVRQVIEEIWNGDLELADQVFAPDYVNHGGLIPDLVRGPEAIKVSVALYRLAFPEFRVAVVDLLAQGQTVALRWAAHTTGS